MSGTVVTLIPPPPKQWLTAEGDVTYERRKWESVVSSRFFIYDLTINPASVSATAESAQTFTATGLRTGDVLTVSKPSQTAGLTPMQAFVPSADQITIIFRNFTASPVDAAEETYRIGVTRGY